MGGFRVMPCCTLAGKTVIQNMHAMASRWCSVKTQVQLQRSPLFFDKKMENWETQSAIQPTAAGCVGHQTSMGTLLSHKGGGLSLGEHKINL